MFDWFIKKSKYNIENAPSPALIEDTFSTLRKNCPGAAFIFARTLHNARKVVDREDMPMRQKIYSIDKEIGRNRMVARADGGVTLMALRLVRKLLDISQNVPDLAPEYYAAFESIAKQGERYRELTPADKRMPTFPGAHQILGKHRCPADFVRAIQKEYDGLLASAEGEEEAARLRNQFDTDRWTLLAMIDLRIEAQSKEIDEAMGQMRVVIRP